MNLLLTNDDGVDADGLAALAAAAVRVVGDAARVTVLAPDREHSGCGHRVTVDRTLALTARPAGPGGVRRFALDGTPADCVRVGLHHFPDLPFVGPAPGGRGGGAGETHGPFDWVLSGCNHGGNLGVDVFLSGTAAAAREATLAGVPALAVSRFRRGPDLPWGRSAATLDAVLRRVLAEPPGRGAFWNANLPHPDDAPGDGPAAVVRCDPEHGPLPVAFERVDDARNDGPNDEPGGVIARYRYRGVYPERASSEGSDVSVCFGGSAALTRVPLFGGVAEG